MEVVLAGQSREIRKMEAAGSGLAEEILHQT